MDYNLAALRTRILVDKLDDIEFDPDVVDRFINDTQRDIFNEFELPFMETMFSGVIPSGSILFKLPKNVAQIQSQVITAPIEGAHDLKTDYMLFREFNLRYPVPEISQPGPINKWTLYANNMMLNAPTDKEYTMRMFYISKPINLIEDADIPQIPEEFSEVLLLGAFLRIQKRNEDFDLAAITEQEYAKQLALMVARYGVRTTNGPAIMKNRQVRTR